MQTLSLSVAAVATLERWAAWADGPCYELPGRSDLRGYGSGIGHWGVQSNWNYAAAVATLAEQAGVRDPERWRRAALGALRLALATHRTGGLRTPDGGLWGGTWIGMLGIERAMHGIAHLESALTPADRAAFRRVLVSEADWVLREGGRGPNRGLFAAKWDDGRNMPEGNIWMGCLLWRVAGMYPEEDNAAAWRDRAHDYFINGVSIEADAVSDAAAAGKTVRQRHVGANFFPHYALDHHGYTNVGYMAICASHAAILYFDMKRAGQEYPATLDHHQEDLWRTLRRLLLSDGRLARIGGDSRVRYAYCQEYLLPVLLYAADRWRDPYALNLAERQVNGIVREAEANGDGSFYGHRLARLRDANPHYFTRLEADRADALAMLVNDLPLTDAPAAAGTRFDEAAAEDWLEEEHGDILTRGPFRFASFAWRSHDLAQALCFPPADSSLVEWSRNLCPVVLFLGDSGQEGRVHRKILRQFIRPFVGGFVTCGAVMEGVNVSIDEGGSCTDQAVTHLAYAALPDGRTCVVLQYVECAEDRCGFLMELKGLHLNVPNDLFNGCRRAFWTPSGVRELTMPIPADEIVTMPGRWLNVDGVLGVTLLYGAEHLSIDRSATRRGGKYASLFVEEICAGVRRGPVRVRPGEVLADLGCAVLAGADATATRSFEGEAIRFDIPRLRGVIVRGADGHRYVVAANFGDREVEVSVGAARWRMAPGEAVMEQVPA